MTQMKRNMTASTLVPNVADDLVPECAAQPQSEAGRRETDTQLRSFY